MTTILEGLAHQLHRLPEAWTHRPCALTGMHLKELTERLIGESAGEGADRPEDPVASVTAHRHHGCVTGVAAGLVLGIVDSYISNLIGYRVTFNGNPAFLHQMLWHMVMFGGIGYFAGRFYEGRQRLQDAVRIIETQVASLKSNQEQLIQSEKLAVIGRLAASVAHEVRNPLSIMRSSADLVAEDLEPEHPGHEPLAFIKDEIDRLSTLIGGLLVFAKPKRPDVVDVEIAPLLDRVMTFMGPEFSKRGIRYDRRGDDPGCVLADGDQIHQVLLGLLVNATEAVHEAGTITVHTSREADPAGGPDRVLLSVADDGPGIPIEEQARIFEPFVTSKSGGTGLGLSVARQIIEGHDGTLDVESRPGHGATFHIRLPSGTPERGGTRAAIGTRESSPVPASPLVEALA